jgi:hypothetical protein
MPWGTVDVKKVGKGTVANVQREASTEFAAHLYASRFPILFAEEPPAITNTTDAK